MSEFNFKSQICTSKVQSERLLALGLKKETADMVHSTIVVLDNLVDLISEHPWSTTQSVSDSWFPAWSLHRLIEMIQEMCPQVVIIFHRVDIRSNVKRIAYSFDICDNLYDNLIDCIEWLIKEGYFNKEYLV